MNIRLYIFIFITLFGFGLDSFGFSVNTSTFKFRNYSMEDGLSMSTIMGIAQTADGYMWFATPDKLNRFDGYEFKTYRYEYGNSNSLSDNFLTALFALPDKSLLIACHNGMIDRLDPVTEKFTHFSIFSEPDFPAEIRGFMLLDSTTVLVYTMGLGICRLNFKTGNFYWLNPDNSFLISEYVQAMYPVSAQKFAYATDMGISFYFPEKDSFSTEILMANYSVGGLSLHNGQLMAATQDEGLFAIDLLNQKTTSILLGRNQEDFRNLNALYSDQKGNLWVGSTFDGLVRIDHQFKQHVFKKNLFDKYSLVNNTIYNIYEDATGNIWFGTISGISVFIPYNQQFELYKPMPDMEKSLSNRQIYSIYEDKLSQIWIGTLEGGLNMFDPKSQRFFIVNTSNSKGLGSNSIRCIFQDSKMRYWVGTGNSGLYRFYPEIKYFEQIKDNVKEPITTLPIKTIFEDKNGMIWLGGDFGLLKWNTESGKIDNVSSFGSYGEIVLRVMEIKQGRNSNTLWVATFGNGLLEVDIKSNKIISEFVSNANDSFSLSNNNVMCIQALNKDTLLVGTFGGGLNIFNISTLKFLSLTEADGMPNDAIYGILVDKQKRWWVSSNKGIAMINPYPLTFKKFDQIEQVQNLEFNEGAYWASSDGYFYFGGIDGLNRFNPLDIRKSEHKPLIHLTGIQLFGKPVKWTYGEVLEFIHTQNFIGFEFVGIDFENPDKLTYQYKLEGLDEDWVDAGTRRFVQYTALKPGTYTFKIKSINVNGQESETYEEASFTIKSPYWLKWWFILVVSLFTLFIVFKVYRYRTNGIRKEFQLKLADLEIRALRSQMNPHFIFNSINSIQYYILNKNPKLAYSYLAKFSSLMRKILQNSRVNFITLAEELDSLELYVELENIRLEGEISFSISVERDIETDKVFIPSMILQPFIENAILHGLLNKEGDKRLDIRVKKEVSHLYCEIEDNGIGREAAKKLNMNRTKQHASTAIKATKERLEILNRGSNKKLDFRILDLKDNQGNATGTKVQIFIPFMDHNAEDK